MGEISSYFRPICTYGRRGVRTDAFSSHPTAQNSLSSLSVFVNPFPESENASSHYPRCHPTLDPPHGTIRPPSSLAQTPGLCHTCSDTCRPTCQPLARRGPFSRPWAPTAAHAGSTACLQALHQQCTVYLLLQSAFPLDVMFVRSMRMRVTLAHAFATLRGVSLHEPVSATGHRWSAGFCRDAPVLVSWPAPWPGIFWSPSLGMDSPRLRAWASSPLLDDA